MGTVPGRGTYAAVLGRVCGPQSTGHSLHALVCGLGDSGHGLLTGAARLCCEQTKGPVMLISCHKPRSVLRAAQYDMASGAVGKFNVVQVSAASCLHCDAVQGWEPACLSGHVPPGLKIKRAAHGPWQRTARPVVRPALLPPVPACACSHGPGPGPGREVSCIPGPDLDLQRHGGPCCRSARHCALAQPVAVHAGVQGSGHALLSLGYGASVCLQTFRVGGKSKVGKWGA